MKKKTSSYDTIAPMKRVFESGPIASAQLLHPQREPATIAAIEMKQGRAHFDGRFALPEELTFSFMLIVYRDEHMEGLNLVSIA